MIIYKFGLKFVAGYIVFVTFMYEYMPFAIF